jgi:hypothetical protein
MAPILLHLTYDDGSTGLTSMEIMKNFGRLVCFVAILICSLARMDHPWNVFGVCTTRIYRYKSRQLTNSLQYSTLGPSCLPSDSPSGVEVCRKPLSSVAEV